MDSANFLRFLRAGDLEWRAASGIDAVLAKPDEPMSRFMAK